MRVREIILDPTKAWEDVAQALDRWTRDVQTVLNGGATLRDQTRGQVRDLDWVQGSSVTLATGLRSAPIEVRLLRGALDTAPSSYKSGGVVSWSYNAGRLSISDFAALTTSGGKYRVTLLVVED